MELACQCPAVVCCRCAPTQKAQIVRLLQERTGRLTCAVGRPAAAPAHLRGAGPTAARDPAGDARRPSGTGPHGRTLQVPRPLDPSHDVYTPSPLWPCFCRHNFQTLLPERASRRTLRASRPSSWVCAFSSDPSAAKPRREEDHTAKRGLGSVCRFSLAGGPRGSSFPHLEPVCSSVEWERSRGSFERFQKGGSLARRLLQSQ